MAHPYEDDYNGGAQPMADLGPKAQPNYGIVTGATAPPPARDVDENGLPVPTGMTALGNANLGPMAQPNAAAPAGGSYWSDMGKVGGALASAAGKVARTVTSADWQPGSGAATPAPASTPPLTVTATQQRQSDPANTPGRGLMNAGAAYGDTTVKGPVGQAAPGISSGNDFAAPMVGNAPPAVPTDYGKAAMDTNDATQQQNLVQQRQTMIAQGDSSKAGWQAQQAEDALRTANNSNQGTKIGQRAVQNAQSNLKDARGASTAADATYAGAMGGRNYVQEAQARQGLVQGAQTHGLDMAKGAQGLATGQQGLQKGDYELKQQARLQDAMQALHSAKTPADMETARTNLMIMHGMDPKEWQATPIAGRPGPPDASGNPTWVGGGVSYLNTRTGAHMIQAMNSEETGAGGKSAAYGPHQNGTRVQDKDGNQFDIVNGQPVPVKK